MSCNLCLICTVILFWCSVAQQDRFGNHSDEALLRVSFLLLRWCVLMLIYFLFKGWQWRPCHQKHPFDCSSNPAQPSLILKLWKKVRSRSRILTNSHFTNLWLFITTLFLFRLLRSHEPHLASVALSNVESSRTVAQVLYDMNHAAGTRWPD